MYQVELDVASPAVRLEGALAISPRNVAALAQNRQVRGKEVVGDAAHESERRVPAALGVVVEEQPPDSARLSAVRQEEVLVAGLLEAGVQAVAERLAGGPRLLVPVDRVFFKRIERSQVEAAAEPPDVGRLPGARGGSLRDEETHVHVRRGYVGISRVHDQ